MPVLFNKRTRRPTNALSSSAAGFHPTPSTASLRGFTGQPPPTPTTPTAPGFHRADSGTSKRTFTSGNTSTSVGTTVIHRPPSISIVHKSASEKSAGIKSISSSNKPPPPPKGFFGRITAGFKDFYRRRHLKYLFPLIGVLIYMLIGAVLFYWLESSNDDERIRQRTEAVERERLLLMKRMEEILRDKAATRPEKRRQFIEEAVDHFHQKLDVQIYATPIWNFVTSMYFAGTLFTTIGYGDVACVTSAGRIVTVVYGLIGIPIMLMTLNNLGEFFYKSIAELVEYCNNKISWFQGLFKRKREDQVQIMEQGEVQSVASKTSEENRRVSFNLRNESDNNTVDQLSLDLEVGGTQVDPSEDAVFEEDDEVVIQRDPNEGVMDPGQQGEAPMPVKVALIITIGWIFFCAALFQLWEDWTYGESWYFMFISMSTIGLGDVSVTRRDMMVLCFVFVIVGLSLVSMCINVIQNALQDLYKRMLMKLLADYQAAMSKGGDHKGASIGMMKSWGNSRNARLLMKFTSANTRNQVMNEIKEEAKVAGVELPPIFEDIDVKSGIPKLLTVSKEAEENPETMSMVNEYLKQSDPSKLSIPSKSPLPTVVFYEADTQTDIVMLDESGAQTLSLESADSGVQTEGSSTPSLNDQESQTDSIYGTDDETQTPIIELANNETMTHKYTFMSLEVQTERIQTAEHQIQTQIVDVLDNEMQTDIADKKNQRSQTEIKEYESQEVQTEAMQEKLTSPPKMSQARRRIRRAFRRKQSPKRRLSQGDELGKEEEEQEQDNSAGSYESLDWDPVDGLHAEKQKPVSDLKRLFDSFKEPKK